MLQIQQIRYRLTFWISKIIKEMHKSSTIFLQKNKKMDPGRMQKILNCRTVLNNQITFKINKFNGKKLLEDSRNHLQIYR